MSDCNQFENKCTNLLSLFFENLRASLSLLNTYEDRLCMQSISKKIFSLLDIHAGHGMLLGILYDVFKDDVPKMNVMRVYKNTLKEMSLKDLKNFRNLKNLKRQKQKSYIENYIIDNFIDLLLSSTKEQVKTVAQKITSRKLELKSFTKAQESADNFDTLAGKKCVLINSLFASTWKPTFDALQEKGWKTCGLFFSDLKESAGYSACATSEIKLNKVYFSDLFGHLVFLSYLQDTVVLLSGEAFHFSNFHGEDTIILYSIMQVFASTLKENMSRPERLFFLMYDGLKPVSSGAEKMDDLLSQYYQAYIRSVDNIIYNSNDQLFGQFVENAYGSSSQRLHFPRYSEKPLSPMKRLSFGENNDEFHMVCITACIDASLDGFRSATSSLVREIIEQGVHFHYYNGDPPALIASFIQSIRPEFRKFFHSHPVNRNQQTLVEELHQYHIALHPSDFVALAGAISAMQDRKYQDGMQVYNRSTQPTSTLVYLSAGLPMLITVGAEVVFAKETAISFTYSEFCNINNYLKNINLPDLCKKADELSFNGWVQNHINELDNFLISPAQFNS